MTKTAGITQNRNTAPVQASVLNFTGNFFIMYPNKACGALLSALLISSRAFSFGDPMVFELLLN